MFDLAYVYNAQTERSEFYKKGDVEFSRTCKNVKRKTLKIFYRLELFVLTEEHAVPTDGPINPVVVIHDFRFHHSFIMFTYVFV